MDDDLSTPAWIGPEPPPLSARGRWLRALPRLIVAGAAAVGLTVADGYLLWLFLVIMFAAAISALPLIVPLRRQPAAARPTRQRPTPAALHDGDWQVALDGAGAKKIVVIKVVRDITGASLVDAKAFVDNAPSILVTGLSEHDARRAQALLQGAGAIASMDAAKAVSTVLLDSPGPEEIQVIKVVRELGRKSLVDAKGPVDEAPSVVATGLSVTEAQRAVGLLQAAGAQARVV